MPLPRYSERVREKDRVMSVFVPEKQAQARAASLLIAQRVRDYFKDAAHRAEFEIWYEQRYGKKYTWKKVTS